MDLALAGAVHDSDRVWLASTDADTVVASDWLTTQVRWANIGVDAVAGLVHVGWTDDTRPLRDRHARIVSAGGGRLGHNHVHGANIGVRASRWVEVDGCGVMSDGEDHELWRRLRIAGARLIGVTDVDVTTSSRLHGRAPAGFSGHLRALAADGPGPVAAS